MSSEEGLTRTGIREEVERGPKVKREQPIHASEKGER